MKLSSILQLKSLPEATDSASSKRKKVETEAPRGLDNPNSSAMTTHHSTGKRVYEASTNDEKPLKEKKRRLVIDRCKKLQCSVILKLMSHKYGWAFMHSVDPKAKSDYCDYIMPKPMDLNTIKSKLDNGLYKGTDEFAADISLMLSNAITSHHPKNEIHRIAEKFRDDFELRWKSLKERWASEIANKKETLRQKVPSLVTNKEPTKHGIEPSRKLKLSKLANKCEILRQEVYQQVINKSKPTKHGREPSRKLKLKLSKLANKSEILRQEVCQQVINKSKPTNHGLEPSKNLKLNEETCPDFQYCQALSVDSASEKLTKAISDAKLAKEKRSYIAKPKQHFLDTILATQDCLLDFERKAELRRKKEREAARVALQKIERTICFDDSLNSFKELELLCGHSLPYSTTANPLECLGLALKDEWMSRWDEEKFPSGDWEEGEIMTTFHLRKMR